jgi:hypothetical protein
MNELDGGMMSYLARWAKTRRVKPAKVGAGVFTDRERLGQVVREHAFLEAVLRHLPGGVPIVDATSECVLFHNRQLTEMLPLQLHARSTTPVA